jgi:hypothetical protein
MFVLCYNVLLILIYFNFLNQYLFMYDLISGGTLGGQLTRIGEESFVYIPPPI